MTVKAGITEYTEQPGNGMGSGIGEWQKIVDKPWLLSAEETELMSSCSAAIKQARS